MTRLQFGIEYSRYSAQSHSPLMLIRYLSKHMLSLNSYHAPHTASDNTVGLHGKSALTLADIRKQK